MRPMRLHVAILAVLIAAAPVAAQQAAFDLSIRNIIRGPESYGREPAQVRFTADGQWIYFRWLPPGAAWNEAVKPYRVAARAGATPERVTEAHMDTVAPQLGAGVKSRDGRQTVVAAGGDLWLRTANGRAAPQHRRLTQTNANEGDPKFSLDGREVLFVRENNVYAMDVATGLTRQLTDIRNGTAPKDPDPPKGQRAAVAEQQKDL